MTSELGIGVDCSYLMARHLNFRYDHDVIFGTVLYKVFHLLLSVIARDRHLHVVHARACAGFADKTWIGFDFDAPSLVINKVQVNAVHLVACHLRHYLLETLVGQEYAALQRPYTAAPRAPSTETTINK